MTKIILLVLSTIVLNATEYFSKIEPYSTHVISAEVSGRVVFIDKTKEYSLINKKQNIIKLDTNDEQTELEALNTSIVLQEDVVQINSQNYISKSKVKQLSVYNKNQDKLSWINSKIVLGNLKRDVKNLNNTINKKEFYVSKAYLDEIYVQKDEYITVGTKLYNLYDFSKSKLVVYVREKENLNLKNKQVYINGSLSEYIVEKQSLVRDEIRVSTYKVILSKTNKSKKLNLGKIVKVEFK